MDYHKLHNMCNMTIETAHKMGDFVPCSKGGYTFIDNGADILGVAHLDTVQKSRNFGRSSKKVYSPRLDDRLGVYTLLHELSDLPIDILLTEDEESMQSTAQYFNTNKQYNWMFQFDRGGTDVVMYQYENQDNIDLLEDVGWTVGAGSYTDICELDTLDCSAFNFGTAYYSYHSMKAYMNIREYTDCVGLFRAFYSRHAEEHLPFVSQPKYHWRYTDSVKYDDLYDKWDDWYPATTTPIACTVCGGRITSEDKQALRTSGMCHSCSKKFGTCPVCGIDTGPIDIQYLQETGMCETCNYWFNRYRDKWNQGSD